MQIVRYHFLPPSENLAKALDAVMFEASATTSFPNPAARAAFQHRWLGHYLEVAPNHAFIALSDDGEVAGYLVGELVDPALATRNADLGYVQAFAPLSHRFPAHLHINLAPNFRSSGVGTRLVEAFAAHASEHAAPGVHVVTGKNVRNVGFYLRNGFAPLGETAWNGRTLVFLARGL